MSDFEKDLLYFASPALLGRKQANLFSFSINCLTDYRKEIDRYKKELAPLGISVEYLYCKKQRVYLLVYRKDMMLHYFKQPAVKEFLIKQGYPKTPDEEASLYETLCILRKRIIQGAEFPHEIGFFFGYPAETFSHSFAKKGITTSWLATGRFTATARPPCIHSAAMPDAEKDSWSKLPQVQILCLF